MKKFFKKVFNIFKKIQDKKKNLSLSSLPEFEEITLIDVGSAGDIEPRWKSVEINLNYIGFEPDERSYKELISKKNSCKKYVIYADALSDVTGEINLNLCRKPHVSSIYPPNKKIIDLFSDPERFDVIKKKTIKTKKLDDFDIKNADFIKLDTQGSELKVLLGAKKTLENVLGLEIEVEFLPIYLNQPLFSDITELLSKKGFEFIDFINLVRWERDKFNGTGQCIFGDALYLKSPEFCKDIIKDNKKKLSSYLAILLLYKRFDLIKKVFKFLPQNQMNYFKMFENKIKKLESLQDKLRKTSLFVNKIYGIFDKDLRNHLLY